MQDEVNEKSVTKSVGSSSKSAAFDGGKLLQKRKVSVIIFMRKGGGNMTVTVDDKRCIGCGMRRRRTGGVSGHWAGVHGALPACEGTVLPGIGCRKRLSGERDPGRAALKKRDRKKRKRKSEKWLDNFLPICYSNSCLFEADMAA